MSVTRGDTRAAVRTFDASLIFKATGEAFFPTDNVTLDVGTGELVQITSMAKIGRVRSINGDQVDVRLSHDVNDSSAPVVTVAASDLTRTFGRA